LVGYERFAPFYDEVMDDPAPRAARVVDAIERFRPGAMSLLELGCGTGAMLERLTAVPELVGLDRSAEMLRIARAKVPGAALLQGDLSSFALDRRFDVIICVFDTLNHVLAFEGWLSAFDAVASHLVDGGLFVFDVNTIGELRRLDDEPPWVYDFDRGVAIIDVAFAGVDDGCGMSQWDIRVFEDMGNGGYRLHHDRIGELGVDISHIRSALEERFHLLEIADERGGPADDDSAKAHFFLRQGAC
jgi:SAM-dependent methyltransferase